MGNLQTKQDNTLLPVCHPQEIRTLKELKEEEEKYDKYDKDSQEQHRIIEKYLMEDQEVYRKDIREYRIKNNCFVVLDRELIRRGENLQMRRNIKWG